MKTVYSSLKKQNRSLPALLAVLIVLPMLFAGCERLPDLTPETRTGANTMSCLVNGRVWIPRGSSGFGGVKPFYGGFRRNYLKGGLCALIMANKYLDKTNKKDELHVYVDGNSEGIYPASQSTTTATGNLNPRTYIWFEDGKTGKSYITFPGHEGKITITKSDTINLIISGTFEGTLGNSLGETIRITNGRFDIDQKTLNL